MGAHQAWEADGGSRYAQQQHCQRRQLRLHVVLPRSEWPGEPLFRSWAVRSPHLQGGDFLSAGVTRGLSGRPLANVRFQRILPEPFLCAFGRLLRSGPNTPRKCWNWLCLSWSVALFVFLFKPFFSEFAE